MKTTSSKVKTYGLFTMLFIFMFMAGGLLFSFQKKVSVVAESEYTLNVILNGEVGYVAGISTPADYSGVLVIGAQGKVTADESLTVNITQIKIDATTRTSVSSITGLDLTNATNLTSIFKSSFLNVSSLSGSITFPASLQSLGKSAFAGTSVEEFVFLGDISDKIYFTDNGQSCIPSTLERIVVPSTSKTYMESNVKGNISSTIDICYSSFVVVDGKASELNKITGDNFTVADYDVLAQGYENLAGFEVKGTTYTRENIAELIYDEQELTPVYNASKDEYTVSLDEGNGYLLTGAGTVEEGETYVADLQILEYFEESKFIISVTNDEGVAVDFLKEDGSTENSYKIKVNNVLENINIEVEGVELNSFSVKISTLPAGDLTTESNISLAANVTGNVPSAQFTWINKTTNLTIGNSAECVLGKLSAGNYTFEVTAKIDVNGSISTQTDEVTLVVSKYKETFSVEFTTGAGYLFTGENSILEGETYTLYLSINENYSESNFVISVLDDEEETVEFINEGYSSAHDAYVIKVTNVSCNLNFSVSGIIFNSIDVEILSSPTGDYDTHSNITLTAQATGAVSNKVYNWEQVSGTAVSFNSSASSINLGALASGSYKFKLTVSATDGFNGCSDSAEIEFVVNEKTYNVTFINEHNLYTLLVGEATVTDQEDYYFQFDIDEYYSDSDYTVIVKNTDTQENVSFDVKNLGYIIKDVNCNLTISITGLTKNTFDVELSLKDIVSNENIFINSYLTVLSTSQTSMPLNKCNITWKLNNNLLQNETNASLNLGTLAAGHYIVECRWEFYEANIVDTKTIEFDVKKISCEVILEQEGYIFNNTDLNFVYDSEFGNNYVGSLTLKKYVFKNGAYEQTSEIKNVGSYKIEVTCNTNEVEFTQNSKTVVEFVISPKPLAIYYTETGKEYKYDGERHFINSNIGVNLSDAIWTSLGLSENDIVEKLYVQTELGNSLVYTLSVFSNSSAYEEFADSFIDVGTYTCELICNNPNFVLETGGKKLSTATYTITPCVFTLNAYMTAIYKSTVSSPVKTYTFAVGGVPFEIKVTFEREAGDNVGEYQILGVKKVEMDAHKSTNFSFNINSKSNKYQILQKEVEVIWSEQEEFVYDGQYHCPTASVVDNEVEITVEGKQYLPNKPKSKYTATAVCLDQNYFLVNNVKYFTINSTTITATESDTNATVNCANGFNPQYSLNVKAENTPSVFEESVKEEYSNKVSILGAYTVKVINQNNAEVEYAEKVSLTIDKPTFYNGKTRILEVKADGSTQEVVFTSNRNTLTLQDVSLGSSFVFISPASPNAWVLAVAITLGSFVVAFSVIWCTHKKIKNKSK